MTVRMSFGAIALAVACAATPAFAQDQTPLPMLIDPGPAPERPVALAAIPAPLVIDGIVATGFIADHDLADKRGGESIVVGSQTMTAITTGNILNGDYAAGAVSLADNALSNFNGIGNLLINTGAQVSLQTGMNLIINLGE